MNVINSSAGRLRRALCHRGLLDKYDVYHVSRDKFGNLGVPKLYSCVVGYFYSKNPRGSGSTVEIAGEIAGSLNSAHRMIAFSTECKISDLIEVGGVFYRITNIRDIYSFCRILDLEEYPYENQA